MHLMFDSLTLPSCSTPHRQPATLAPLCSQQGRLCQLCVLSNRSRQQGGLGIRARGLCLPVACCSIPRYTRNRGEVAVALRPRVSRSTMQSLLNTDCRTKARKHESGVTSGLGYDGCPSLTRLSACVAEQKRFEVLRRLKACLDSQAGS